MNITEQNEQEFHEQQVDETNDMMEHHQDAQDQKQDDLPDWIHFDGEHYVVKTRHATYKLRELSQKEYVKIKKLATMRNTFDEDKFARMLIARSAVDSTITDNDIENIKAGDYIKLETAIQYVYGINDLL